jgi:hypothetical protein
MGQPAAILPHGLLQLQQQDSNICAADGRQIITKLGTGFEVSGKRFNVAEELQQALSAGILLDCRTTQLSAWFTMTLGEVELAFSQAKEPPF